MNKHFLDVEKIHTAIKDCNESKYLHSNPTIIKNLETAIDAYQHVLELHNLPRFDIPEYIHISLGE